ncbi:mrpl-20 [Pristionchus pacificus]|uniref:Mrpl-20 n=1 Tax=Pristionchus pacificus TaxID=54126 RepID=A0A454Y379_PRIPA|nr:mrpl-20 [Pristionchus pacificus]|eukprot:PDM61265.1 mrpl-20 [Pristionchus pacificus]
MKLTTPALLRRIINSTYHPFSVVPKPDVWMSRERLHRFTAWQYGSERATLKGSNRKQNKLFHYLDMQRSDAKKNEQFYASERLDAALSEYNMEYKHFRNMLDKANILLDNVVLSQLAIYEPRTFESLVSLTRAMAISDGRTIEDPHPDTPSHEVSLDQSLFGPPRVPPVRYTRGPGKTHTIPPRKLTPEEY